MPSKPTLRVGVVAGEYSGDRLGSGIIEALKINYNVQLFGVGGPEMINQGLNSEFDFKKLHIMGLIEPLLNLRELTKLRKNLIKKFAHEDIDYFIGIDSPDFNIGIHKALKNKKISKNIQIVSPSVWGWRQGRIKSIKKYIDFTACLFNFEDNFYKERGLNSIHLGHPFSKIMNADVLDVKSKFNLRNDTRFISILPGSRESEIKKMLPTYIEFIKKHNQESNNFTYLIPAADRDLKNLIDSYLQESNLPIVVESNCSREFLSISEYSVVTSGTASLEAAVLGADPIICYKTSALNFSIISRMLKVKHIGLPNLLLNNRRYPELLQNECTADRIFLEAKLLENDPLKNNDKNYIKKLLMGEGYLETAHRISLL